MTVERFFDGHGASRALYEVVSAAARASGPVEVRVVDSQIAFRRPGEDPPAIAFAWAWVPARWQAGAAAPLALSIALPSRDGSPRWRRIGEGRPGQIVHHLELSDAADVDDEVRAWLAEARAGAA